VSTFEAAIPVVLANEGDAYVPDDAGRGPSRYGITLETAQAFYPDWTAQDIFNLTAFGAEEFYRTAVWERWHVGLIADQALATGVFDRAVNLGPKVIAWLQQIVGVVPDMLIGPVTAAAVNAADPVATLAALRSRTAAYYQQDVTAHPEKAVELAGWLARNAKG
jgi:lysozyme family protein